MSREYPVIQKYVPVMVQQFHELVKLWDGIIKKRMVRLETLRRKISIMQQDKNEHRIQKLLKLEVRKSQFIRNFPNNDELLKMAIHHVLRCHVSSLPRGPDAVYFGCSNRYYKNDTPIYDYMRECEAIIRKL
jgi:hypothetical protein